MSKFDKTRKALQGASAGRATAIAFLNVAMIVVKLVQTVTEDSTILESGGESDQIEDSES